MTSVATMRMNTGMRISCGIRLRSAETAAPESAITRMVASDSMAPLTRLVVTASSGHRPRICTRLEFCFQTPLAAIWRSSAGVMVSPFPLL